MDDGGKTRQQLIDELTDLRQCLDALMRSQGQSAVAIRQGDVIPTPENASLVRDDAGQPVPLAVADLTKRCAAGDDHIVSLVEDVTARKREIVNLPPQVSIVVCVIGEQVPVVGRRRAVKKGDRAAVRGPFVGRVVAEPGGDQL